MSKTVQIDLRQISEESANPAVRKFMQDGSSFALINCLTLGGYEGYALAAETENFSWLFVLHPSGFGQFFRAGNLDECFLDFLTECRLNKIVPNYFHLYDFDESYRLPSVGGFSFKDRTRMQFAYIKESNFRQTEHPSHRIRAATPADSTSLSQGGLVNWKAFWPDYSSLLEEGVVVVAENRDGHVDSVCYSAAIDTRCAEIDVATRSNLQALGLGFAVVQEYCRLCAIRGLIPGWDCFSDNIPSISLAKKTGFVDPRRYRFLSVFDSSKH